MHQSSRIFSASVCLHASGKLFDLPKRMAQFVCYCYRMNIQGVPKSDTTFSPLCC